jgi:hypothetical protein
MTLAADTPGSFGEIARVHSSFILGVNNKGEVTLRLWTEEDEASLTTTGFTINDGTAHDIAIEYDGAQRLLQVLVDGEVAASDDVTGNMPPMKSWGLTFGDPWGKQNYDATVTSFDLNATSTYYPTYAGNLDEVADTTVPIDDRVIPVVPPRGDEGDDNGSSPSPDDHGQVVPDAGDYQIDFAELSRGDGAAQLHGGASVLANPAEGSALILLDEGDYVELGQLEQLEFADQLTASVTFSRTNPDGAYEQILWNEGKLGIALEGKSLLLHVGTSKSPFHKAFEIQGTSIDNTNEHTVTVSIDAATDRLQVIHNGQVAFDKMGGDDIVLAGAGSAAGWTIGSSGSHDFEGAISDLWIADEVRFYERPDPQTDYGVIAELHTGSDPLADLPPVAPSGSDQEVSPTSDDIQDEDSGNDFGWLLALAALAPLLLMFGGA